MILREHRIRRPDWNELYNAAFLNADDGILQFDLTNGAGSKLIMKISGVVDNRFRVIIEEPDLHRYRIQFCLEKEPETNELTVDYLGDDALIASDGNGNRLYVSFQPISIEFYHDDILESVFDGSRLIMQNTEESQAFTFTVKFNEAKRLIGLHEHPNTVSLMHTADYKVDPYRLKNVDYGIFGYSINVTQSMYGSIPVLYGFGEHTSGIFVHNGAEMWVEIDTDEMSAYFMVDAGLLDLFVLMGPTLSETVRQYTDLTGKPHLPQLWALGHHQSRWAYNNTEDVKDIIGKFDEYRFPMDVLWLDIEYTADRKWFTWNTTSFPDPIALLDWVEEQGHRKLVPISESNIKVDPEYKIYDDCLRNDYFINNANGTPFVSVCWAGDVSWIDFLNPEAREYYAQLHLYENFPSTSTLGGYWNDMNEPALFDNTYERTIPSEAVQYGNVKHRDVHNMYGLHQLWALGHHQSRWAYNNTEDVKDIIGKFDEYRFPMDVLWLDIEYTADRKWFTWNTTSFPDPIALLDWVEEQGHRKLVPISESNIKVDPEYKIYDDCLRNDYFINNANGTPFVSVCWAGDVSWIDFLNPEAREYYAQLHLYENFPSTSTLGGYWNDMNEPALFDNTYERTIPSEAVQYGNVKHRDVHNMYGLHQVMTTHQGLMNRDEGNLRPFLLSRSIFAGSQRYTAKWNGDTVCTFEYLRILVPMTISSNLAGLVFYGGDVPGFFGKPTDELASRWYQTGAWIPFYRAHADLSTERREPWVFSEETQDLIREAIESRYKHLPYWYTLFYEHTVTGDPLVRPLLYHYPNDEAAFDINDQFLVGKDILVANVYFSEATSLRVYLPGENEFWYQATGPSGVFEGGHWYTIPVDISFTPVFYRSGSIIARKPRVGRTTADIKDDPHELHVVVDDDGFAETRVYIDDFESFEYLNEKKYLYVNIEWDDETQMGTVTPIDGASDSSKFTFEIESVIIYRNNGDGTHSKQTIKQTRDGVPLVNFNVLEGPLLL
ncbi:hypothetical protein YQE_03634 [Dendroctonus ponderosae]|uniref:Glucosidase II subunit alpha n=1 Tax=Dendroctonus ponderosae TaxID=77166 RepID=N6UH19_DENPD|nr:hypothetical protein YQE_03634 [Dendroctonus ponderosae]